MQAIMNQEIPKDRAKQVEQSEKKHLTLWYSGSCYKFLAQANLHDWITQTLANNLTNNSLVSY